LTEATRPIDVYSQKQKSNQHAGKSPSKYHLPLNFTILIVLPDSSVHVPTYLIGS
jgi:hypothetical protein